MKDGDIIPFERTTVKKRELMVVDMITEKEIHIPPFSEAIVPIAVPGDQSLKDTPKYGVCMT